MVSSTLELRELFHLAFLRHLGFRLTGRSYAVKGGICLRFFHRSQRFSQDMDLDAESGIRLKTLQKAVDSVLEGKALAASLFPHGISRVGFSTPKQTETTQRWKIALFVSGGTELTTKVEFSRRQGNIGFSSGIPNPELLARYGMPPFACNFYSAPVMAIQKINALGAFSRFAARDLYDLDHLLEMGALKTGKFKYEISNEALEKAAGKAASFTFADFQEQVVPYLSGEIMDLFGKPDEFEKMKGRVEQALMAMLR